MTRQETFTATLPNGLRIVHIPSNDNVVYCGLAVNVGSRDDAVGHYGMAHFVEHTIFKGTTHRNAWHIINRMESVGGELECLYHQRRHSNLFCSTKRQYQPRHRTDCRLGGKFRVPGATT